MATARAYARIDGPAEEVWALVTDPTALPAWFPGVQETTLEGDVRTVTTTTGVVVRERIVTNDAELRRFQYSLLELPGLESHVATVDVLADGDGVIAVYAADVKPDAAGAQMQQSVTAAVEGLKKAVETR